MRIPRDLSGAELVKRLGRLGYVTTRQTGSHMRLSCPNHDPLADRYFGSDARHHGLSRDVLLEQLFSK